jgi:HSP20 family protein
MSNLTRWEPVREMMTLREAMDRLFDDAFTHPLSTEGGSIVPAVDLYQNADEVVIKVSLPGLKAGDVQISVTADVLILRVEFKDETEEDGKIYQIRENRYGTFEHQVILTVDVQTDKVKAYF